MSDSKTATERLREMLTERGIDYEVKDLSNIKFFHDTRWNANGVHWCYTEFVDATTCLTMCNEWKDCTPEQAVAVTLDNSKSNNYKKIIESKSARIEELRRDRDSLRSACNIGDEIIESLQSINDQKNKRISELEATLGNTTCVLEETESYKSEGGWVHVLKCSNCGQGCERVNGSYEYCPKCSAKVVDV